LGFWLKLAVTERELLRLTRAPLPAELSAPDQLTDEYQAGVAVRLTGLFR